MADPVLVPCPKDTWTLVAAGVTAGQIWIKDMSPYYVHQYKDAGGGAPTDLTLAVDFQGMVMDISAKTATPIDVYIYAKKADGVVRVDL